MPENPPDGFEVLASAAEKAIDSQLDLVGVVADFLPGAQTKGKDYMITFTLTDPSWSQGEGLKCRYFGRNEKAVPDISSKGDVVVLRSVKLKCYNGQTLALSNYNSSWVLFHQHQIPFSDSETIPDLPYSKMSDQVPSPSRDMMAYAVTLCNLSDRSALNENPSVDPLQMANVPGLGDRLAAPKPTKFQLVQDLTLPRKYSDLKFANLLGEVRKIYMNDFRVELTITDYTAHDALYDYVPALDDDDQGRDGDEFNYNPGHKSWPGPWGKMSMVVSAWDAHAKFAREYVGLHSLVFLRNVQITLDKEGSKMEGKLRGNRYHPESVNIAICKPRQAQGDDRVKAFLKRKRDYEATLKLRGIKGLEEPKKQEEQAVQQKDIQQQAKEPNLARAERNKRKREKKKARKQNAPRSDSTAPRSANEKLNPHIRTNRFLRLSHPSRSLRSPTQPRSTETSKPSMATNLPYPSKTTSTISDPSALSISIHPTSPTSLHPTDQANMRYCPTMRAMNPKRLMSR